jgi:phosphoserine aminotransferase
MVPMNLLRSKKTADYLDSGIWSKKAIDEAARYCQVNIAGSSKDTNYTYAPSQDVLKLNKDAAYFHFTSNETIGGVEIFDVPTTGDVPVVCDMSSHILSRPMDVSQYGVIYAGAQKNIGPAGLTIVIVREDLIGETIAGTPTMFDYKIHADNESMYNTPATYGIYMAGLVFKWLKLKGGLSAIEKINIEK